MSKLSRKIKKLNKHNGTLRIETFYENGSISGMINDKLRGMKLSKLMNYLDDICNNSSHIMGKFKYTKVWVNYYTWEQKKAILDKKIKMFEKELYTKYDYKFNNKLIFIDFLELNDSESYEKLKILKEQFKKFDIIY